MKFAFLPNGNVIEEDIQKEATTTEQTNNNPAADITLNHYDVRKNIYANQYNDTSRRFHGFIHLFLKWSGSVFKLIWHNLLVFMGIYTLLTVIYRCILVNHAYAKELFEIFCIYCSR